MKNPFEFGRELGSGEPADREAEIGAVVRALDEASRLLLIGPRRFGKTSILRAAAAGTVVLRYDAEAYPALSQPARAMVGDATKRLSGTVERAAAQIREFFGSLRPQVKIACYPFQGTRAASLRTSLPRRSSAGGGTC